MLDGFTNDCCRSSDGVHDVPLGEIAEGYECFDIFAVEKNDTNFSNCLENVFAALKKYYPQAKILFVRPHKMGKRDKTSQKIYGERAVEICRKWSVEVADIYSESALDTFLTEHRDAYTFDSYNQGFGDCTHPNAECYKKFYMPIIERKIKEL